MLRPGTPQVRSRAEAVPATRTSLVGRRRPGSVQSVCSGVQVSTKHGTWIPVGTLSTCVQRSFLVAVTYAQLVMVNWTSPVSICPRTGDGRSPTLVLHPGTRCLTISRTLIFPFKLSNVILRHFSFSHTSTLSMFEVSYKNSLYKFTVIIIIIIIIINDAVKDKCMHVQHKM